MTQGHGSLSETRLPVPLGVFPETELLNHTVILFSVLEEPPYRFPQQRRHLTFPSTSHKDSSFSTFLPTLVAYCLL